MQIALTAEDCSLACELLPGRRLFRAWAARRIVRLAWLSVEAQGGQVNSGCGSDESLTRAAATYALIGTPEPSPPGLDKYL